jgi:hypothetical protein
MSEITQQFTIQKVKRSIAQSEIEVDDVFINELSLQQTLKANYNTLFSEGRFKEFFILYLGRMLTDIYHSNDDFLQSPLPEEGETHIAPLYGCADACCVYLYVKVRKHENLIYWEQIGRNTAFINPSIDKDIDKGIEWLPDFEPITFDFNSYNSHFKN